MPVGVRDVRVGPREGLPDPRGTTGRRVCTLTTCPVTLISRQAEHARTLADTRKSLCTDAHVVSTIVNDSVIQRTHWIQTQKQKLASVVQMPPEDTAFRACTPAAGSSGNLLNKRQISRHFDFVGRQVAAWCGLQLVNALVAINWVALRRARLLLGWVTVCGQANHLGM